MFQTLDGIDVDVLTAKQMREVDRVAIEETGPSLLQMMENAGASLADFAAEQWPRMVRIGPVLVLAGPGHNGGGGICAAYHLLTQGVQVRLSLACDENRLRRATAAQLQRYRNAGGVVESATNAWEPSPILIIDALLGYGASGPAHGAIRALIEQANAYVKNKGTAVLSLDIPSGTDPDTPCASCSGSIRASKSLTLALPKRGLVCDCSGELWLADIGIPDAAYQRLGMDVQGQFVGAARIRLLRKRQSSPVFPGAPMC